MEFAANIQKLQDDIRGDVGVVRKRNTEVATRQFLVLPFIQTMGYSRPADVDPEFTVDIGTKKSEKVDYALMHDGSPSILVECKKVGSTFGEAEISQLMRYFTVTDARFGILTDGLVYQFYADLEKENIMDDRPFFTFNMLDFMDQDVDTLKMFTKDEFDKDKAKSAARRAKFLTSIKQLLRAEVFNLSPEFFAFIKSRIREDEGYSLLRIISESDESELDSLIRQVCEEFIDETESKPKEDSTTEIEAPDNIEESDDSDDELTQEEFDAFEKVRTLLGGIIDQNRLVPRKKRSPRDSYLGVAITVDGNRRKSICHIAWRSKSQSYAIRMRRGDKLQEVATVDAFDTFAPALREKVKDWV